MLQDQMRSLQTLRIGYPPPNGEASLSSRAKSISSPEKAATMDISFGKYVKIHQLSPDGTRFIRTVTTLADGTKKEFLEDTGLLDSTETWELKNPIITRISWGELDYGDDGLVEYVLDIKYDYAILDR